MNAARILSRAGVDSEQLRHELEPVDPEAVNVWPAGRLLRLLWRSSISGVTLHSLVLVDPEVLAGDHHRLARLVVHELVHVRQFNKHGYFSFMARYIREYLSARRRGEGHRAAYLAIGAEMEARETAHRYV